MKHEDEEIRLERGTTARPAGGALLVSLKHVDYGGAEVVAGVVGEESTDEFLTVGSYFRHNSPTHGKFEIRLLSSNGLDSVVVLVSRLIASK